MQNAAEDKYRETERKLVKQQEDLQDKLSNLKIVRKEDGKANVILTSAQQKAFENFRTELFRVRKELRDVQGALRQDIESLDTTLKALNIWAVPLLIALLAVILAIIRRNRYRQRTGDV